MGLASDVCDAGGAGEAAGREVVGSAAEIGTACQGDGDVVEVGGQAGCEGGEEIGESGWVEGDLLDG